MTEPRYLYTADSGTVVHPDCSGRFVPQMFEPAYWKEQGAIIGGATGRGAVLFVRSGEEEWVLRHYRRGGMVGRVLDDEYLWTGRMGTRAFREWHLLAELHRRGLPVPRPVAARYRRAGLIYRADMITARLPGARPLSRRLADGTVDGPLWERVGACIRRFHDAGVCHPDLNAHNVLIDDAGHVWLVDFDRGRRRPTGRWREANLARLLRSLHKIGLGLADPDFESSTWQLLLAAYREA